jgi:fluoride exporter
MLSKLFLLAAAGAAGTLARYGLAGAVQRVTGAGFPWGTFAVNAVGAFAAGLLWQLVESRVTIAPETRVIVFIGFLGSFTTFSTLMLETNALVRNAEWAYAAANLALHNLTGLAALVAGVMLGRLL